MDWRIILLLSCCACSAATPLRVHEFSAAGHQGLVDEDGDTPDWIEIQNVSGQPVDLGQWHLSDDQRTPKQWRFPSTNLPAQSLLVVFASGKDRTNVGRPLHANFKLSSETGDVVLTGPNRESSIISNYPAQVAGISFGVEDDHSSHTYLIRSTPGETNSEALSHGPHIHSLKREPALPATGSEEIHITARVSPTIHKVLSVRLKYRVMFNPEIALPMLDDGKHADGQANDGTFGASIPPNAAKPGQIIRYCVIAEDADANLSRWPLFVNRANYSAYEGLMIPDPSVDSRLPVYHFFTQSLLRSRNGIAASAVLFHDGELYDNVRISEHGQITRSFPKPGFNLDFPFDHRFRYRTNAARVSDLKILANFPDKSKIRNTLAYELIAASGSIAHFAFPVRLQKNGEFFCVAEAVEDGDDRWLERVGLDPQGALYKMYGNLSAIAEAEKKTRQEEAPSDLAALAAALTETRPLSERVAYSIDHVDIPQCISYLVAMTLVSSGDHGHKNYYLYRDTRGSGEWSLLPWDVDLSLGRNWTKTYFDDQIYSDNPLSLYRAGLKDRGRNPLYNVFFEHPPFRQMYLRRLRTVVDELLAPTGREGKSRAETRTLELMDLIDPPGVATSDAALDNQRWQSWGVPRSARQEARRITAEYLPARREFLLRRATLHGDSVPQPQPTNASPTIAEIDAQCIRLENTNKFAIDISKWRISGAGIQHTFRPGTVLPSGGSLRAVADVRSFRSAPDFKPGTFLIQGNWSGMLRREGNLELRDQVGRVAATREIQAAP